MSMVVVYKVCWSFPGKPLPFDKAFQTKKDADEFYNQILAAYRLIGVLSPSDYVSSPQTLEIW